jgi:catechol 2,3-dioxygenase-like lactoylglutathione lyase family enzyme
MISHLDHLVLTCTDLDATKHFYTEVMGMGLETFGAGRIAFKFGNQKINLHQRGAEFEPKAHLPVPGRWICVSLPLGRLMRSLRIWATATGPLSKGRWSGLGRPARSARCMCGIRI